MLGLPADRRRLTQIGGNCLATEAEGNRQGAKDAKFAKEIQRGSCNGERPGRMSEWRNVAQEQWHSAFYGAGRPPTTWFPAGRPVMIALSPMPRSG
jgi:hypothetical protein